MALAMTIQKNKPKLVCYLLSVYLVCTALIVSFDAEGMSTVENLKFISHCLTLAWHLVLTLFLPLARFL